MMSKIETTMQQTQEINAGQQTGNPSQANPAQVKTSQASAIKNATSATASKTVQLQKGKNALLLTSKKSAELSRQDSIKLNLLELYPEQTNPLKDNSLTRYLHPAIVKEPVVIVPQDSVSMNDSTMVATDSLKLINDSIAKAKLEAIKVVQEPSLPEKTRKQTDIASQTDWLTPVLVVLVTYTGILRMFSGKYISNLFKSMFNAQNADNLFHTINMRNSLPAFGLDVLFILNLSTFAYESLTTVGVNPGFPGILVLLASIIAVTVLFFLKSGSYRFISYIFQTSEITTEFLFYVSLHNRILGLLLLPLVIAIPFVGYTISIILIQCGLVMFIATYLLQLVRGAKIILRDPSTIFYMFLYLCALEILPLVVIYKMLFL
jgi:hypothetical protein